MTDLHDLTDRKGHRLPAIPLSPLMLEQIDKGETVEIRFHTPKALRALGREHSDGAFQVWRTAGGRLVTDDPKACREYGEIQERVRAAG